MPQTGSQAPASPERILQTGLAFWASKTLLSAVELELFTGLAEQPATCEDLRARLGLHPRAARDFFDALVALGFLQRDRRRLREHAARREPVPRQAEAVVRRRHPRDGEPPPVRVLEPSHRGAAHRRAAERGQGRRPAARSRRSTPIRRGCEEFLAAMTGISHGANMTIAAKFPWQDYKHVRRRRHGAGRSRRPGRAAPTRTCTGTGLDLPVVQPIFEEYAAAQRRRATASRSRAVDFFSGPLPKADVVMMGHILHDWDLAQKKHAGHARPTTRCRRAAPSSSTSRSSTTSGRRTRSGC